MNGAGQVNPEALPMVPGPIAPGAERIVRFAPIDESDPTWCSICRRSLITIGARYHDPRHPHIFGAICMACVACLADAAHVSNGGAP